MFLAFYYSMRMVKNSIVSLACFGATALAGCADSSADSSDEPVADRRRRTYSVVSGGSWGCKTCGFTNSPAYGLLSVGTATYGDHSSLSLPHYSALISPGGQSWGVDFDQGQLFATDGTNKVGEYDLIGWTLRAKWASGDVRDAVIYGFDWVLDWTDSGGALPTYGLVYLDSVTGDLGGNICEGMSLDETSVVFLEGERYDSADGSVIPNENGIANAACRGHALAKMALVNYVPYNGETEPEEREATLRMFRADYCGDGTPHTAVGTPVDFTDNGARNFREYDAGTMGGGVVEAHWTEEGATCVGIPRLPRYKQAQEQAGGNGFLDCEPPPCDEQFDGNVQGVWASLVPPVVP